MATLKEDLKFMDSIFNKVTKKESYLVLKVLEHNVWVIDPLGEKEPLQLPKHTINRNFIRVDPNTVKVLYSEAPDEIINDPITK